MSSDEEDTEPGETGVGPPGQWQWSEIPAVVERLPQVRDGLADWAGRVGLNAQQVEDVTLASYEALANAAMHAYPDGQGTLAVHAQYRPDRQQAQITVADAGQWQPPPDERDGLGGRGLVLIRNLAEHAEVHTDGAGTTVSMRWTVPSPDRVPAD